MQNGALTAQAIDGSEFPVIDLTLPAFSMPHNDEELAAMERQYLDEASRQQDMPESLREALRNSMLGSALMASAGTFLAGLPTYLLKLGPENLGPGATAIDRRIAASFPALCTRLRLMDISLLMSAGLSRITEKCPAKPLCLVNIGGGVASDSWNALILMRRLDALLLEERPITIAVLDPDQQGPAFGARALQALCQSGAPLNGLQVNFQHLPVGWSDGNRLQTTLKELGAENAICGISSEGALFEYGSDEEIVSSLAALHAGTAPDALVVGSVTREGECTRASRGATHAATQPRTLEAFTELAAASGWQLQDLNTASITRPFSFHIRLVKS